MEEKGWVRTFFPHKTMDWIFPVQGARSECRDLLLEPSGLAAAWVELVSSHCAITGCEGHLSYFSLSPGDWGQVMNVCAQTVPLLSILPAGSPQTHPVCSTVPKVTQGQDCPGHSCSQGPPAQHRPRFRRVSSHREGLGSTAPHLLCHPGGTLAPVTSELYPWASVACFKHVLMASNLRLTQRVLKIV